MFSFRAIFIGGKCSFLQKWEMTTCCLRGWSRKYLYKAVEISEVKASSKFNETFPREGLPEADVIHLLLCTAIHKSHL